MPKASRPAVPSGNCAARASTGVPLTLNCAADVKTLTRPSRLGFVAVIERRRAVADGDRGQTPPAGTVASADAQKLPLTRVGGAAPGRRSRCASRRSRTRAPTSRLATMPRKAKAATPACARPASPGSGRSRRRRWRRPRRRRRRRAPPGRRRARRRTPSSRRGRPSGRAPSGSGGEIAGADRADHLAARTMLVAVLASLPSASATIAEPRASTVMPRRRSSRLRVAVGVADGGAAVVEVHAGDDHRAEAGDRAARDEVDGAPVPPLSTPPPQLRRAPPRRGEHEAPRRLGGGSE